MGRTVPFTTDDPLSHVAPAPQGQPPRGAGAASSAALSEASLAAEVSLRSLSSLLLASRGELDRRPLSLAALSRPLARPPLPPPSPPYLAPPAGGWRALLSDAHLPSSPPPLAPASEGSDSDADLDDLPALLSSPSSQRPSLEDLLCPWGADGLPPRGSLHLQPLVRRGSAGAQRAQRPTRAATGYFGAVSPARRRGRQQAEAAPAPALEDELQALAGRLAELVGTHQARLRTAHPGITEGLQDVANQLHRLAAELEAGPPPLA